MKQACSSQSNWEKVMAVVNSYWKVDVNTIKEQLSSELLKLLGLRVSTKSCYPANPASVSIVQIEAALVNYSCSNGRLAVVSLFGVAPGGKFYMIEIFRAKTYMWPRATASSFLPYDHGFGVVSGPPFQARLLAEELERT